MKMNFEKMNRDMPIEQEHNKQALLQKLTETSDMDHPIDLEKDLEIQLKQQQTVVDHAMGKSLEASKELRKAPEFKKIFETNDMGALIDDKSNTLTKPEVIKRANEADAELRKQAEKRNLIRDSLDRVRKILSVKDPNLN